MQKEFEFKGYFWQPENPKDECPGIIKFNPTDGISLELFGHFTSSLSTSSKEKNIILGFTSGGKKVTLLNCYEVYRSFGMPGFSLTSFTSLYLFIGEQFSMSSEINFKLMQIGYEDINHWLDFSGFEKFHYDNSKKETTVKYKRPEHLTFKIIDDWQLNIEFSSTVNAFFKPTDRAEIKQICEIILKPRQVRNFEEFKYHFATLNSLLSVCYFSYPKIISIEFLIDTNSTDEELDEVKQEQIKVELYFKNETSNKQYKEHNSRHNFLITYLEIQNNFTDVLKNWFDLKSKIEATINILTECFMNRGNLMEFQFLSLAQAMENMHRRLTGLNKVSFKNRIDSLIVNIPEKIKSALLSTEQDFAERIKQNRNYFTHYDEQLEDKAASLGELFIISEKMKIVLLVNVLKEIGLSDFIIEKIILSKGAFLFNHIIKVDSKLLSEYNI